MATRYVGIGGNDGNDGLSWANRKLTLNGAEDTPVVAGDIVYVGPGAYRESLTVDVSGSSGSPITYIADVTGENTDDIGGIVRVTGSDNDQSATRANCISNVAFDYRTFRGFFFDTTTGPLISCTGAGTNWIIEDCVLTHGLDIGISVTNNGATDWTVRRCLLTYIKLHGIYVDYSSAVDDCGWLIENCYIATAGVGADGIRFDSAGSAVVKNCTIYGQYDDGVDMAVNPNAGQAATVNNCIFINIGNNALEAAATGGITEDFNTFWGNNSDRSNVAVGGSSVTYPPLFVPPTLFDGMIMPWWAPYGLSEWSQIARLAGSGEAADDFYGVVRPTTSAKKSWGALQLREAERETGTVRTGSAALTLADAGDHQIYVPVTATSTTFSVYGRYESEYAGTLPRLIVRQPGAADQVDTMVAAADTWEQLSLTFAPNADPPYVIVIFRSLNTSVTGSFDTYWDDLDVS